MAYKYAVAEISFFKGNPVSRYIVKRWIGDTMVEVLGCDSQIRKRIKEFNYYQEICRIKAMEQKCIATVPLN